MILTISTEQAILGGIRVHLDRGKFDFYEYTVSSADEALRMCESIEVSCFLFFDKGLPPDQENSKGRYALIDSLHEQQSEIPIVILSDQPTEHFYNYALQRCHAFLDIRGGIKPHDLTRALRAVYSHEDPVYDRIEFQEQADDSDAPTLRFMREFKLHFGRSTHKTSYVNPDELRRNANSPYAHPETWQDPYQEEVVETPAECIPWSSTETDSGNDEVYHLEDTSSTLQSVPESLSRAIVLPEPEVLTEDDETILADEQRSENDGWKVLNAFGENLRRMLLTKREPKAKKVAQIEDSEDLQTSGAVRTVPSIISARSEFPGKVSIGVFSLSRGAGATHTAIAIAEFFARRGPTALMAYDLSHDLEQSDIDERVFVYIPTKQEMNEVIAVMHSNIVSYIVYDFGTPFELYHNGLLVNSSFSDEEKIAFTELQRCDRKVCLSFAAPWHRDKSRFLEQHHLDSNLTLLTERQRNMDITELMNRLYPGIVKRRGRGA
ncbi:MAG: hypothetical protein FWE76_08345 [Symbiobacteriaceae bacterium]|nr:hypothetical protein [Symbiobacteriaceae bacterium]